MRAIISPQYAQFPFETRTNSITDDYEVSGETLGTGVSGEVKKCVHRVTRQNCALKVLQDSDKARREVIIHKKACENCDYIVKVLDIYELENQSDRFLLLVMERMDGGELFNRITQRSENPYTERDAARFISMIVQAVAHLHAMDIAHRDLKPENLLFTSRENDAILKLTDFGFAKEGNNQAQPLNTPCYTPYYVAPEVLSRTGYDKACDIWSMGVIMYILLCCYPPFYPKEGNTLTPDMRERIRAGQYEFDGPEWEAVSEEAISTIRRMLTVNPAERITIEEILNCSWLKQPTSDRTIDTSSLGNTDNRIQMQVELASANDIQRRGDDDIEVEVSGPEASNVMKKRQAKKRDADKKD